MSTTNAAPGEQPGQDTQTEIPAGAQPQDIAQALESQTAEQLLELITGKAPEGPPPAATPPATTAPQDSEQPPVVVPQEDAPPVETPPEIKPPPGRASHRFLPEEEQREHLQALDLVREKKAKDLPDAYRQLRGEPESTIAPPPAAGEESATAVPSPQATTQPGPLKDLQDRLTDLREQRKQAKMNFEPEEEDRLTNEIEDTLVSLQEARTQAALQQQQDATYDEQYQAALNELDAQYPDARDDTSTFSELLDALVIKARVDKDPILKNPRYVLEIAERLATTLAPKPPTPGTPPTGPTTRAQRPTGSAVAPGHVSAPRYTQDQEKAIIDASSPEALLAALTADFEKERR